MDYLAQISNTFYLRLPIPIDLQGCYNKREIKKSLHTKKKTEARSILLKLLVQYQQEFFQLRNSPPMPQKPPSKRAIEIWLKQNPGKSWLHDGGRISSFVSGNASVESIQSLLDVGYEPDAHGKFDTTVPPQNDPVYFQQQSMVQHAKQRPVLQTAMLQESLDQVVKATSPKAMTIAKAVSLYLSELKYGKSPKIQPKSEEYVKSVTSTMTQFTQYVGGTTTLDKAAVQLEQFTTDLMTRSKSKVSAPSANQYGGKVVRFFKWCRLQKYTTITPEYISAESTTEQRAAKGNRPFNDDEGQKLLDALTTIPARSFNQRRRNLSFVYFCLTLFFSGFRKSEALDLVATDFQERKGVHYLNISVDRIAQLKTFTSPRVVPMHHILKDLGILNYLKHVQQPFPWSYSVYRCLMNTILYGTGIKTRRGECLFHSFRHGFESVLNATGELVDSHRKMLAGHKVPGIDGIYLHLLNQHLKPFNDGVQRMPYATMYDFSKLKSHLARELKELY